MKFIRRFIFPLVFEHFFFISFVSFVSSSSCFVSTLLIVCGCGAVFENAKDQSEKFILLQFVVFCLWRIGANRIQSCWLALFLLTNLLEILDPSFVFVSFLSDPVRTPPLRLLTIRTNSIVYTSLAFNASYSVDM